MSSDSSLLERQMAEVELRPFTLDDFHRRRHQKQRNRRIASSVLGLVLLGVVAGGILERRGEDDQSVDTEVLGPLPSPFAGEWESIDGDGSSQTMLIERVDGDEHSMVMHDDRATVCSGAPATLTGSGAVRTITELAISSELTCDDGSTPLEPLALDAHVDLTFTHEPEADELFDSLGVMWQRPGPTPPDASDGAGPIIEGPSPFEGTWVVGRKGQYFPDSLEIHVIGERDLHEAVSLKAETPQCAGGPSTMRGTGRRQLDGQQRPGLVVLAVQVALTCDDGSTPVAQTDTEAGVSFAAFGITYIYDPVTDELLGSLGSLFTREGAQLADGDPMTTIEGVVDAINARDTDAFTDLFAPDGGFAGRGYFSESQQGGDGVAISEGDFVKTWMAMQDAWGFEAELGSCIPEDPSEGGTVPTEEDARIVCKVVSRWPKLSLEITEQWGFELRGARLVRWDAGPFDIDPSDRALPLGYSGLEAWESWLRTNHPDDAARWLVQRSTAVAADFPDADDPEREAALAPLRYGTEEGWVIDGFSFNPAGLIPYDPQYADAIDASIDQYLEETGT